MTDFDRVLDDYEKTWIKALDPLEYQFPFAAACLACAMLDHLGNVRAEKVPRIEDHSDVYQKYILKYLGPAGFPDNQELRERFYRTLRSGLVHEARTDDHRNEPEAAARVLLTHLPGPPENVGPTEDFIVSAPWLCQAIRTAWGQLRAVTDEPLRARVSERLKMVVQEASSETGKAGGDPADSALPFNTFNQPATGFGGNFNKD